MDAVHQCERARSSVRDNGVLASQRATASHGGELPDTVERRAPGADDSATSCRSSPALTSRLAEGGLPRGFVDPAVNGAWRLLGARNGRATETYYVGDANSHAKAKRHVARLPRSLGCLAATPDSPSGPRAGDGQWTLRGSAPKCANTADIHRPSWDGRWMGGAKWCSRRAQYLHEESPLRSAPEVSELKPLWPRTSQNAGQTGHAESARPSAVIRRHRRSPTPLELLHDPSRHTGLQFAGVLLRADWRDDEAVHSAHYDAHA